jgi:altronate hydrolase
MASISSQIVRLSPKDNCVVAVRSLSSGQTLVLDTGESLTVRQAIPPGHKVAIVSIAKEDSVVKYGWPIGRATENIEPGQHIHSHNLSCEHRVDISTIASELPPVPPPIVGRTFQGIVRPNGAVGTRNYVAVISTVNCSASVSRYVAQRFTPEIMAAYPNVDGVVAFRHEGGCAMAFDGMKHRMLNRVIGGIAKHPNIGAYVLIGLGCEQSTIGHLLQSQKLINIQLPGGPSGNGRSTQVPAISIQDTGGTLATIERGVEIVAGLLPQVNDVRRQTCGAEHLILGTNCGGSDGYSGITANPAVGIAVDRLVACGGTGIVAETSELYGAEQTLIRRARSRAVAEKLLERIEWWKWYVGIFGETLDCNPSAGNKAGGLTTIIEKSLGAAAKGGNTTLEAVYEYAEPVTAKGLVVMDTPGYDPASVTGLVAGGSNLVVFTTGRGSCFGCKPVPSLKISTNSEIFRKMPDDMDVDAGTILTGETVESVGERIFERLLEVASGDKTKSEILGYGDEEFVPWTVGPML